MNSMQNMSNNGLQKCVDYLNIENLNYDFDKNAVYLTIPIVKPYCYYNKQMCYYNFFISVFFFSKNSYYMFFVFK